jgi:hypothetical protein
MSTEQDKHFNIPAQLHVGFNERNDTYTGKLAYVVYTDEKGKLRKGASWNSWRDHKIDPMDVANEPTSGFVLNKGVGGACRSWGWIARNEYIRVYDPRGFEIEISVANLLFILTECNSIKGKGLEGEFVYAWDGTELVLLPVDSYEYKTSKEFTSMKSKKITKNDMKEGLTYRHKDMRQLVYLGPHKIRELPSSFYSISGQIEAIKRDRDTRKHVFYDVEKQEYTFERGFTRLAEVLDDK